jgi:hypothetical protein
MPREWHPLRLFVDEDGRRHPTILFWLFSVPVVVIMIVGGCSVLNRREDQTGATMTPTSAATEPLVSSLTPTSGLPTGEPTATAFVYDDPSGWEFVERTDPTGKTYLDLQDWQREQVWHAFEEFWDLRYRSEDGMTPFQEIAPYVRGRYLEAVELDYEIAGQNGEYVYLLQPLSETSRALVLESSEPGNVKVKVVLVSDVGFLLEVRDARTGDVLRTNQRFSYRTWDFTLTFSDGRWIVEDSTAEDLE